MGDSNNPLSDLNEILDSEPVKNLLSPVTKEVGEFLGTLANLCRFYATENLGKIFGKWEKFRHCGHPLSEEEYKKVMPLFPLASMVSDDELQEKWAALMESIATKEDCLPSFGLTLSQLTVEEVQYLDRLWKIVLEPTDFIAVHKPGRLPLQYITLVKTFDPSINAGVNSAEIEIFKQLLTEAQKANYEQLEEAQLVIDDLVRLRILGEDLVAEPDRYLEVGDKKVPFDRSQTIIRSQYSFTQYGVSFMQAVTASSIEYDEKS
jgi:hypothetical protein